MSSGDDQHLFSAQEFVVKQLRQRAKRNSLIEEVLQFNVSSRHRIADHHQIRPGFQIAGIERLRYRDSQLVQKV